MKTVKAIMLSAALMVLATSCERVAPNYVGVLMEDYGKNGKADFSLVKGRVGTLTPGTELFQVPLWEQRADFGETILHLKDANNTEFTSKPIYSFMVIEDRAIDVVFENKHLGSGSDFMTSLEDNILETKIYDIMKEESRKYTTDSLMANGGNLLYEEGMQKMVSSEFEAKGLRLMTFSCQLDFTDKVKEKINTRNEVSTNITVLDQQILEQLKQNRLDSLKAVGNRLISAGITPQLLQREFIQKWDGHTPLYGTTPITFMKDVNPNSK